MNIPIQHNKKTEQWKNLKRSYHNRLFPYIYNSKLVHVGKFGVYWSNFYHFYYNSVKIAKGAVNSLDTHVFIATDVFMLSPSYCHGSAIYTFVRISFFHEEWLSLDKCSVYPTLPYIVTILYRQTRHVMHRTRYGTRKPFFQSPHHHHLINPRLSGFQGICRLAQTKWYCIIGLLIII